VWAKNYCSTWQKLIITAQFFLNCNALLQQARTLAAFTQVSGIQTLRLIGGSCRGESDSYIPQDACKDSFLVGLNPNA
jgi:hypothetical protein